MKDEKVRAKVITWFAGLPADSSEFERVCSIYSGEASLDADVPWFSLKEVADKVNFHPVWLSKLGVQAVGTRLGGRLSYHVEEVVEFLKSEKCAQRIRDLHAERVRHEQVKKGRAA